MTARSEWELGRVGSPTLANRTATLPISRNSPAAVLVIDAAAAPRCGSSEFRLKDVLPPRHGQSTDSEVFHQHARREERASARESEAPTKHEHQRTESITGFFVRLNLDVRGRCVAKGDTPRPA